MFKRENRRVPLFIHLGFNEHPFAKTNADEEPELAMYFVPPPYFDAVVGDSNHPSPSVVLAPRGAGKTALRRMVENHAIDSQFLAVTYDRFEFSAGEKVANITLQYHMRNIIVRVLLSFLSYLSENPDVHRNLTADEKQQLSLFVTTYLGDLTGAKLQELLNELKSLPEKFKQFWSNNIGVLEPAINFILKSNGLPSIDLPDKNQEEKRLSETYKYQLELLLTFVKKLRFKSIYILIDRVDETELTGNNPEATYNLIKPLLKDLELLGLNGYAFKFFLWDKIKPYFLNDARPDRISQYELSWSSTNLKKALEKRMQYFSGGDVSSMQSMVSAGTEFNVDDALSVMSNKSPRNLIRMCEQIMAVQADRNGESTSIDLSSIDIGVEQYSEMLFREIYGEEYFRDVQRVGRELFSINYIANDIFKIQGGAARNKVTAWIRSGLAAEVGTVSVPTSKKPLKFYCFVDPVAVVLIYRSVGFEQFFKDRWLPCDHCGEDNLMDIDLYPDDNDAVCRSCGRMLIERGHDK